MARYDLTAMARQRRNPRKPRVALPAIRPKAMHATDLYQAGYADVTRIWADATPSIIAAYERALAGMVTDSPEQVGKVIEESDGALYRLYLVLRPQLERWAIQVERWHRGQWRGAVLSATGVDLSTMIGAQDVRATLATVVERNVSLVRSVSDEVRQRIADATFRGLSERRAAVDVAKDIREATGMGKDRAKRIASDQLTKLSSSLDQERRREAGLTEWQWVSSGKVHFRPEHQARDGKVYSDDNPPSDLPGELVNCACTSKAVLSFI